MNLNELAKEVHQTAIEHGWREEERDFGEVIALMHSELSEALEEYRNNNPPAYFTRPTLGGFSVSGLMQQIDVITDLSEWKGEKPEGVAVELADVIIRILDYCGKVKFDIEKYGKVDYIIRHWECATKTFGGFIALVHKYLSAAYEHGYNIREDSLLYLGMAVSLIYSYCEEHSIPIEKALEIKVEYNKTRPYKHGGKKI